MKPSTVLPGLTWAWSLRFRSLGRRSTPRCRSSTPARTGRTASRSPTPSRTVRAGCPACRRRSQVAHHGEHRSEHADPGHDEDAPIQAPDRPGVLVAQGHSGQDDHGDGRARPAAGPSAEMGRRPRSSGSMQTSCRPGRDSGDQEAGRDGRQARAPPAGGLQEVGGLHEGDQDHDPDAERQPRLAEPGDRQDEGTQDERGQDRVLSTACIGLQLPNRRWRLRYSSRAASKSAGVKSGHSRSDTTSSA